MSVINSNYINRTSEKLMQFVGKIKNKVTSNTIENKIKETIQQLQIPKKEISQKRQAC